MHALQQCMITFHECSAAFPEYGFALAAMHDRIPGYHAWLTDMQHRIPDTRSCISVYPVLHCKYQSMHIRICGYGIAVMQRCIYCNAVLHCQNARSYISICGIGFPDTMHALRECGCAYHGMRCRYIGMHVCIPGIHSCIVTMQVYLPGTYSWVMGMHGLIFRTHSTPFALTPSPSPVLTN